MRCGCSENRLAIARDLQLMGGTWKGPDGKFVPISNFLLFIWESHTVDICLQLSDR